MTIVATTETRNSKWANDPNAFGRKMLSKMGWKGEGLGKNQQGTSTHLRAVKRAESLGIGADTDAFGEKGWNDTNAGFHGVLAKLKREHSSGVGESGDDDGEEVDEATKKKRRKEEKKRKKKEEKRRAKKQLRNSSNESGNSSSSGSDTGGNNNTSSGGSSSIRLPQNKVQAGHARKMREAKDIRNKSAADMAAIFGVKADLYKQPKQWVDDNNDTKSGGGNGKDESIVVEKKKKSKKKKFKEVKESIDKPKKDKKKRKRSNDDGDASSSSDSDDASPKKKRKRKKDKAKK